MQLKLNFLFLPLIVLMRRHIRPRARHIRGVEERELCEGA